MTKDTPLPDQYAFSGKRLYNARKSAKMSRFTLSKAINFAVGAMQINRYELGKAVPTLNVAIALARALQIPLKDLTDATR